MGGELLQRCSAWRSCTSPVVAAYCTSTTAAQTILAMFAIRCMRLR